MAIGGKILLIVALLVIFYSNNTEALKHKVTHVQFYMHDIVSGPNATAVQIVSPKNSTSANPMFGSISMMDNPLTATPDRNSTLIGRAQGLYGMSTLQSGEFSLLMSFTVGFVSGPYNGSTFSVLGRNPIMNEVREMPVIGGTGIFRLAQGYCFARTYSFDQLDAVIGYNVTLMHYY